jgi:glycosyltransferase involved in cell wall biosynthesis
MDKRLLRFFPHLIAVSTDVRDELVRHGAKRDRVTTILNGIDHRAFQRDRSREPDVRRALGFSTDAVMIGAVGRLEPQKRFDLLIDAMPAIRSQYSKALLVIVGDGSQMAPLRAQTERLGLANVCLFLGHRTDVVTLHHAFDLFVQSSDYEGTPNAVLEAMALETPIVATRAGGTEEVVRDGLEGRLVPLADRQALVDAVCSVLSDPRGAHQRAISARLRIESVLSFDARMKAVEKIYTTLVTAGIRRGPRREHAAA